MNITPLPRILVSALALSVAVTSPAVTQEVEEAPSTVNATYVAESATDALEPGEKIEDLFTKNVTQDYLLQKLTDRIWFFQSRFSGTMFYVGDGGRPAHRCGGRARQCDRRGDRRGDRSADQRAAL